MTEPHDRARDFTELRPLLFTIAYEITGSATDADDVVQDSYLRWAAVDPNDVDDVRSYVCAIVTRQSLNTLRAASRRREEYVGPWLPEPLRLVDDDPATDVVLAESVTMAMMVILESLTPDERAVFVLREVFGFPHAEIAAAVGRSVDAVRQTAHRARTHVASRRRRFHPPPDDIEQVTTAFASAARSGDVQTLMDMLAPDAVLISDGGGKMSAARRPIRGADKVARFLVGIGRWDISELAFEVAVFNGAAALVVSSDGRVDTVFVVETADGAITGVYAVRNPDKLTAVHTARHIAR